MTAREQLMKQAKEISLLTSNFNLLDWDQQTGMPEKSAAFRGELSGYIQEMLFEKSTGAAMKEILQQVASSRETLNDVEDGTYRYLKREFDRNELIPPAEFAVYQRDISLAYGKWKAARTANDYQVFAPSLEKLVAHTRRFIPLWKKNKDQTPYDVLLDQYEPGMTVAKLDPIFEEIKGGLQEIRQTIAARGTAPAQDFLSRFVAKEAQRRFVEEVVTQLGFDFSKGRLDDTIHPFMTGINRDDTRVTTRWNEHDFSMAVFGIMHEAGHGMYEQNIAAKFDYTPLSQGTSMGIHESQSLFNEVFVGSNPAFWQQVYPRFQAITGETFADIPLDAFYRSLRAVKNTLIRIEADPLTYPLHIIIRYEIEKKLFNEGLSTEALPEIWRAKYQEYLGIAPSDDLSGVLQDVHWAGASFGYFPSYALGYLYAAQFYHAMGQTVDIDRELAQTDKTALLAWNREHIHRFGASKTPSELLEAATGEPLNPQYLLDFLRELYYRVYRIKA